MSLGKNKIIALIDDKNMSSATDKFELFINETIYGDKITKKVLSRFNEGDTLVVQNVLYLGSMVNEVVETLNELSNHKVNLFFVDEGASFRAEKLPELVTSLRFASKLHRSLISERSRDALQERKSKGFKLGRPFGHASLQLDGYKEEIRTMLASGITISEIAKKYGVCWRTISNYLKRNPEIAN